VRIIFDNHLYEKEKVSNASSARKPARNGRIAVRFDYPIVTK